MKLESLAIIFIIIIMPITIVLSEYIDNKITTGKTELEYDTKLLNSTHDAIRAYQVNTIHNAYGDISNKKIEDIEIAVQTFYNSLITNFNYTGYRSEVMKEYVPAIVFTMYDGYYIYSPFNNVLTEVAEGSNDESYSKDGNIMNGLKPYVYYTCRYKSGTTYDFSITYTLDNYITIQGIVNGSYHYDYGYLYSIATTQDGPGIYKKDNNTYYYNGIEFTDADTEELKEYVGEKEYSYVKINGQKYYLEEDKNNPGIENTQIFFIHTDGSKNYSQTNYKTDPDKYAKYYDAIKKNKSAYEYYKNAYEFSSAVLGSPVTNYQDKAGKDMPKDGKRI